MYNHYRHIIPAPVQSTPVTRPSSADIELATATRSAAPSKIRTALAGVLDGLPFLVALAMIAGFAIAIYPLAVQFLPTFVAQSPLAS